MAGTSIAGGHRLQYEEAGAGPAFLLIHIGGADSSMWDGVWDDGDVEEIGIVWERTVRTVPGARRVVLSGVDHFVPMRAPGPFLDALAPFLEEAPSS